MNTALLAFDLFIIAASMPWLAWSIYCIQRTAEDRHRIIAVSYWRPVTGSEVLKGLDTVSFKRHLRARFWRRDPWKLYDTVIRDALDNPRTEVIGMMPVEPGEPPPRMN